MGSPIEQFTVEKLIPLQLGNTDLSFTNSALAMTVAVLLISALLVLSVRRRAMIPGRWQSVAEILYEFVASTVRDSAGTAGLKYFPFVFSLFLFLLFGNILGVIPFSFTFTSHIILTFALAAVVFVGVTILGFALHGFHYLRMFFPEGSPPLAAVILVPVELISYLSRPFSLAMRLSINMTVGHVMLWLFGSFIVAMGVFGILPMAFLGALTVLEMFVALLQAFVFTILTCVYLNDAIHMH